MLKISVLAKLRNKLRTVTVIPNKRPERTKTPPKIGVGRTDFS